MPPLPLVKPRRKRRRRKKNLRNPMTIWVSLSSTKLTEFYPPKLKIPGLNAAFLFHYQQQEEKCMFYKFLLRNPMTIWVSLSSTKLTEFYPPKLKIPGLNA